VSHLISSQIKEQFVSDRSVTAESLLQKAYTNAKQIAHRNIMGSTTACVAVIQADLSLNVINLGDSGLFVVRNGTVVFQTRPTVEFPATDWSAAAPKQLAIVSPTLHSEDSYISSPIEDGAVDNFKLETHDWVFAASDGVLDNLMLPDQPPSPGQYKFTAILRFLTSNPEPTQVAQQLVSGCKRGPKIDDITALVFRVDEDVPKSAL
jgi:protein phosphatase PTC7